MTHELEVETRPLLADEVEPGNGGHHHHTGAHQQAPARPKLRHGRSTFRLAVSATVHCLIGCGIGEVAGMVIATALGMSMISSMVLAVALGFVAGLALGVVPLLRAGFDFKKALKIVVVAEGLSIAVMEAFEVATQVMIPGVMEAGLASGLFWMGMGAGLAAGFVAALPVNYVMIRRGVRHLH